MAVSCKVAFVNREKGENLRPAKLYKNLEENMFEYDNITVKFSAEIISGEQSDEFSGIIRIQNDSLIWISLRSYNIEGARICITPDSVKYLNRMDFTYYVGDFAFITEMFQIDMDYNTIQSIISNNFFFYPEPEDTAKAIGNFKPCDDSSYYCMSSISQRKYTRYYVDDKRTQRWDRKLDKEVLDTAGNKGYKYESNEFVFQTVKVLPELFRVHDVYIENYIQQQSLYVMYDKQMLCDGQYFPHEITMELQTPKFASKIILNIESVTIDDDDVSYPFKISDKYQEIIIQ
jgi:hypothetical protein